MTDTLTELLSHNIREKNWYFSFAPFYPKISKCVLTGTVTPVCGVYPLVAYRLWKQPIGDQWINAKHLTKTLDKTT